MNTTPTSDMVCGGSRAVGYLAVWLLAFAGACGGAELGEACDVEGDEGECVDEAVCGKPGDDDALECLAVCDEQEDCPNDEECNGVTGSSLKACRPKK